MRLTFSRRLTVCLALIMALVGCGGGDAGGGGSTPLALAMTLSATSLNFAATDGSTPAAQTVTANFSGTGSGTLYVLATSANPALISVGNVTVNGATSGQAVVTPAAATTAGAGDHSTTIQVIACLNDPTCKTHQVAGSPQTINVTYTVAGVSASVAGLTYTIGNSSVAADYSQTFKVSGYPTQTWKSAVTNAPWLSLEPSTGSTDATVPVQATLDQTQVGALANGIYTGSITLSAPNGIGVTLPVSLTLANTKVDFVAPYVGTSNISDTVIIRGEGFRLVPPTAVNFGSTAAASFTVVSDTEIDATYPTLVAGTYPVQIVASDATLGTSRARLVIVDPPNYRSARLSYAVSLSSVVTELAYDAERQALLVQFYDMSLSPSNELLRFAYGNGVWAAPIATNVLDASDFALSIDGTQLLSSGYDSGAGSNGEAAVMPLNPATLLPIAAEVGSPAAVGFGVQSLAVANNGHAIIETSDVFVVGGKDPILEYAELPGTISVLPQTTTVGNAVVGASSDGATVLVVSNSPDVAGGPAVAKYDTSAGQLTQLGSFVQSGSISIDRHGTRVLLNAAAVYDQNLTFLGSLPGTTVGSVLSPDAHRAYAYDSSGSVRVFDLTAAPNAGLYPEIMPPKSLPGPPAVSTWARLIVSPDSGSLFVALGSGIYIVPLP
jgi:hypothetical protein